ncbi:hypothetical protein [Nocardia sp. NPDC050406]|uniref:hypothetical protein n=1 Tax=Nocardia sp. NPDC050406 TaxID=3364318 RepID=UPI0037A7D6A2
MTLAAKRIAIAFATVAAALTSTAGIAAADNGSDKYHWYCDRDSRGYDWDYCWKHYSDRYQRDHNTGGHDNRGGNDNHGGSGNGNRGW